MRFAARHAPCGTVVEDDLPDGYPLSEGVGLWCPACRASFWAATEATEAAPAAGTAPLAEPEPEPPAVVPPIAAPPPRLHPPRHPTVWPVVALLGLTAAATVGVVLLLVGQGGDDPVRRDPPPPAATATAAATPAPTAAPAVRDVARRLAGTRVTVTLPTGWLARRDGDRLRIEHLDGPRVTVSAAPRRGRSLARLGRDTRAHLAPRGRARVRRVRQGGRRAVRVVARGHEVTALVLGDERWVIARDVEPAATRRVARSVRIR